MTADGQPRQTGLRAMWQAQHTPEARRHAIHEAGHAVAAYLLGRPFVEVNIVETDTQFGEVTHHQPAWFEPDIEVDARTRQRIDKEVMIAFAGSEAEAAADVRAGDVDTNRVRMGASGDMQRAVHLADYLSGSNPTTEAYLEYMRQQVLDWVGRPGEPGVDPFLADGNRRFSWLVYGLADALQARGRLSWREARKVLQETDDAQLNRQLATHPVFGKRPMP